MDQTKSTPVMTNANMTPRPPITDGGSPNEIMDEKIIAKPLMSPGFANAKPKREGIILRWVNFHVGQFGDQRLREAMAEGWKKAGEADAIAPGVGFSDGCFKVGDLLLMFHDRATVLGAYKHNAEQAMNLISPFKQRDSVAGSMRTKNGVKGKMSAFVPSDADIDALGKS